jgi:hypothetical protein
VGRPLTERHSSTITRLSYSSGIPWNPVEPARKSQGEVMHLRKALPSGVRAFLGPDLGPHLLFFREVFDAFFFGGVFFLVTVVMTVRERFLGILCWKSGTHVPTTPTIHHPNIDRRVVCRHSETAYLLARKSAFWQV